MRTILLTTVLGGILMLSVPAARAASAVGVDAVPMAGSVTQVDYDWHHHHWHHRRWSHGRWHYWD